jgi:hypothetical protein
MWQFATIWTLLPTGVTHWIVNLMLLAGVIGLAAGWIGRWIPPVALYSQFLKPLGIVLLVAGVYLKGGEANNDMWLAKIADLEAKIAVTEAKSKDANTKLSTAVKEKNQAIQETKVAIQSRLSRDAVKIDAECRLDSQVVEILNDSARDIPRAKANK